MEDIIISIILFSLIGIIAIIGWKMSNQDSFGWFRFRKRLDRLSWKKVIRTYIVAQGFFILAKLFNKEMIWSWTLTFVIPTFIVTSLLVLFFFLYSPHDLNTLKDELGDDYEPLKKRIERDNKINRILK